MKAAGAFFGLPREVRNINNDISEYGPIPMCYDLSPRWAPFHQPLFGAALAVRASQTSMRLGPLSFGAAFPQPNEGQLL